VTQGSPFEKDYLPKCEAFEITTGGKSERGGCVIHRTRSTHKTHSLVPLSTQRESQNETNETREVMKENPTGTELLALASVSPDTVNLLSDEELVRLEALCHSSQDIDTVQRAEKSEAHSGLIATSGGLKVV